MKIVHVASEFAPLAKAGGLGEVVVGLAREQNGIGEKVSVIFPKYDFIKSGSFSPLKLELADFKVLEKGAYHANAMWTAHKEGCHLHLLEARHPAGYFHRGAIYGEEDDAARFLYFSRAVAEYLKIKNEPIDILHLHDWHTAPLAALVKEVFKLPIRSIVLTLHSVEYQGRCAPSEIEAVGLNQTDFFTKEKFQDEKDPNLANLLKGGIVYADKLVAVSPSYAKEILTPEYGFGLDRVLKKHRKKLFGILNGLDAPLWDPKKDLFIPKAFGKDSAFTTIEAAKEAARKKLAKKFHLDAAARPWIGTICRLVPQKGPALIEEGLRKTVKEGGVFFLLGSLPALPLREKFLSLQEEFQKNPRAHIHFAFDEELAHLAYAAFDLFLMPSLYEPCGLTQMIAMLYGTIPIARETGGLKDTIFDALDPKIRADKRNGFLFKNPTREDLYLAIEKAVDLFRNDKGTFQSLIRRAIHSDFSWEIPARAYHKLYLEKIVLEKKALVK